MYICIDYEVSNSTTESLIIIHTFLIIYLKIVDNSIEKENITKSI